MSLLQAIFPTLHLFFPEVFCVELSFMSNPLVTGLRNTVRHRGPSMPTKTVYLYRLYQS